MLWVAAGCVLAHGDVQGFGTSHPPCQATLAPGTPRTEDQGWAGAFQTMLGLAGSQTWPKPD